MLEVSPTLRVTLLTSDNAADLESWGTCIAVWVYQLCLSRIILP